MLNMGFFSQFVYSMLISILSCPFYRMLVVMLPMSILILICSFGMLKEKKASKIMILDTTALENNPMSLDLGNKLPKRVTSDHPYFYLRNKLIFKMVDAF